MLACIACHAEHGPHETHAASDCARRIRALEQAKQSTEFVVRPLRKDWKLFQADRKAA